MPAWCQEDLGAKKLGVVSGKVGCGLAEMCVVSIKKTSLMPLVFLNETNNYCISTLTPSRLLQIMGMAQ